MLLTEHVPILAPISIAMYVLMGKLHPDKIPLLHVMRTIAINAI